MNKIAFIGAGNMNRAIIIGLINNGVSPSNIMVTNPSPEKRQALANQFGILETSDNIAAAKFADTVVLGVKPHFITAVCEEISSAINIDDKLFVSIAAGTTLEQIQNALGFDKLGKKIPVVRTMPNTPSQLGLGVSGAFRSIEVTEAQKNNADQLMQAVGKVKWLTSEAQINDVISVSGSGPAYFFLFMEAMQAKAKALGFNEEDSRMLVEQTALGAAHMVIENRVPISQLRENVTSKGGTTQAALTTFIEGGLEQLVDDAMQAAIDRAEEMAKG